jgi:dihydrolipoamide dehydrogenase
VRRLKSLFKEILLNTKVDKLSEGERSVSVEISLPKEKRNLEFDRVLVALGRRPKTEGLGLDKVGVALTDRGFIAVDDQRRTSSSHIFAIGDIAGEPLLAHKATYEGKIAAEVIAGKSSGFDATAIPAVVYTDPQIAWCGITENQAKKVGRPIKIERFPWRASGRALSMGLDEGITKIIADPENNRIIGVGVVGRDAESLIAEGMLAIEMGALVSDLALTMHPHPTLSETEAEAAEIFLGGATHVLSKST